MKINLFGLIAIGVVLITASGCGQWERTKAKYAGWSEVCVDGVTYLQFPSGVTVKYSATTPGIVPCSK